MGKIVTLKEEIYRKIAAGEVVERPFSVVKELVENSLDAGAETIRIELEHGGKSLVRVVDDGSGFDADDVEIAFRRHSTSKFREFSDFDTLDTLGFRGEALPSILEVSDINIETSSGDEGDGLKFNFRGGSLNDKETIAYPKGTSITVKNLFSNFPVRKKFLKSDRSEMNQITGFLEQVVLVNYKVSFELTHNGKTVFSYDGVRSLRERSYQVFGKEFTDDLIDIEFEYFGYRIKGLVSKLNTGVSSKKKQYFFVNGRNVREKTLYAAFNTTFQRYLEKSRNPAGILLLEIPPGEVDVNIHPMKLEIKFEDSSRVFQLIKKGIENVMGDNRGFQVEEAVGERVAPYTHDKFRESGYDNSGFSQQDLFDAEVSEEDDFIVIGQYKDSYIIIEKGGDLLVVDQHNADERSNFDRLKKEFTEKRTVTISPLFPLIIELTPGEAELLDEGKKDILRNAGFELEHMGGNSYDIKGYPEILNERSVSDTVREILGIESDDVNFEDRALAEIACKSSIKVNYKLHDDQMRKVVRALFRSTNPYFCPHKRPIIINFSLETIEKTLKRK
ncbi:MAG: DNA mismatch repair endonuclease MutL [Candidatus Aminicenantes bacterium]|nr:DNA mismatch repair endonuclease MutL [Candidatus Aminicenantes bacterium]